MSRNSQKKRSIVFFLIPQFTMLPFAAAVETLRIANRMLGYAAYEWRLSSLDGQKVMSSSGICLEVDTCLADERRYVSGENRPEMAIICSGIDVDQHVSYGSNENGLGGTDVKLAVNAPLFVEHFQAIADLAKDGTFRYGGRTSEAKQLFMSGECGILTESSGGLGDIVKTGMNYGIGQLPYYEGHGPQNTIPGGASLWVFGGKSDAEYKGVAEFFHFLSQTKIQSRLHQVSGYMPVTIAAYEETKKSGFYDKNPARETPLLQMMGKPPTENSKGVRLVNLPQVRDIMNEEFEAMLAGKQDAKAALDKIVERGDAAIKQAAGN